MFLAHYIDFSQIIFFKCKSLNTITDMLYRFACVSKVKAVIM